MRSLILSIVAAALAVCASTAIAMDVTELKLESSNKVVIKVRFDNGSVADPADRHVFGQGSIRNHDTCRVHARLARQALDPKADLDHLGDLGIIIGSGS